MVTNDTNSNDNNINTGLRGMAAICKYMNRSEATILSYIRKREFPATKLADGNIWESDKLLINDWRRDQIAIAAGTKQPTKPKGKGKKK